MDIPRDVVFLGVTYRRFGRGKYYLSITKERKGAKSLHTAIWEHYHQTKVPEGYEVHHRDSNPFNNSPENLECITKAEHRRRHAAALAEFNNSDHQRQHLDRIRPLASEWHRTEEGKSWHKQNALRSWQQRSTHDATCVVCGVVFPALRRDARCCSTRCIQRRQAKLRAGQTVQRVCVMCGKEFAAPVEPHKDRIRRTCSRSCASKMGRQ